MAKKKNTILENLLDQKLEDFLANGSNFEKLPNDRHMSRGTNKEDTYFKES